MPISREENGSGKIHPMHSRQRPPSVRFRFSPRAFVLFASIFGVEVLIALFVHDRWIRGFVGDVLVVAVVFYFLRSFLDCKPSFLAIGVLLFAWAVEAAQSVDFVTRLGLQDHKIARIVLGSTFDWLDVLAYAIGAALVWCVEALGNPAEEPE